MKRMTIIKNDGNFITLNFNTEKACADVFNAIMNTCDRKEIAQINIINTVL